MTADARTTNNQSIEELDTSSHGHNSIKHKDKIIVDGRGYKVSSSQSEEPIYNLEDVIEETQIGEDVYEEILQRSEKIVSDIARKVIPDIAERIIREEIEKLKNSTKDS